MPFAVMEKIGVDCAQQAAVKRNESVIVRLGRAASQEHGELDVAALELPVIDELRAWDRRDDDSSGVLLGRRKAGGGTRLVMILDEAQEPILVA
jgi:hypothetical protein